MSTPTRSSRIVGESTLATASKQSTPTPKPFTPYPWIQGPLETSVISLSQRDEDPETQDWHGGKLICNLVEPQNMAVICLAPEMVESIMELVGHLETLHHGMNTLKQSEERLQAIARARAILIKIYSPKDIQPASAERQ